MGRIEPPLYFPGDTIAGRFVKELSATYLEPAFQDLLVAIHQEQERCNEFRRFHVMELSATSRGKRVFELTDKDRSNPEVKKRIQAKKSIHLHENDDEKKLPDQLAELALSHKESNRAVLVFARTVESVEKIAGALQKANQHVETLTGTLRGKERDELVDTTVFRRFLPGADAGEQTVYLCCTSAGEVGVNISADHLACDLSTFESMAQRFGRVNRFGARNDTRIDIVHSATFGKKDKDNKLKIDDLDLRRQRTLDLLRKLNGDGSPEALSKLDPDERLAAFSP
jgi:CRISPR-associated endonuclease/helicase Cas3